MVESRICVRFSPDIPGKYVGIIFENEVRDMRELMPIPPELFTEIQDWVIEKSNDPWKSLHRTIDALVESVEFRELAQKLANALGSRYHLAVRVEGKIGEWEWVEPSSNKGRSHT